MRRVGVIREEFSVKWAFKIGKSRQIKQKSHKGMCFWVVTIHRRRLLKRKHKAFKDSFTSRVFVI